MSGAVPSASERALAGERRARRGVRWQPWRLVVPVLLVGVAALGYGELERLRAADERLRAAIAADRQRIAEVRLEVARGASGQRAPLSRLRAIADGPGPGSALLPLAVEPWHDAVSVQAQTGALGEQWLHIVAALGRALGALDAKADLRELVEPFEARVARLLVDSVRLREILVATDGDAQQMRAATRQTLLVQRLESSARRLLTDEDGVLAAADRLGRDALVFGEVNNALLHGNAGLDVERVEELDARAVLERLGRQWREASGAIETMVARAVNVAETPTVLAALDAELSELGSSIDALERAHRGAHATRTLTRERLAGAGALAGALLVLAVLLGLRDAARLERAARVREAAVDAQRARSAELEDALEDLALVLGAWSRGALGVRPRGAAELPPGLVKALEAVSAQLAPLIEELREENLDLGSTSPGARVLTSRVARAAVDQNERVDALARTAREMIASLDPLSAQCTRAGVQAEETRAAARAASGSIREAVDGLADAQTAGAEIADRVSRAGAELRVLRDLVELLEDLAEQAKLLSVNVAIQSSMDGEAGRALANFSDDVQRLSEQARQGMRRIVSADETLRRLVGDANDAARRGSWTLEQSAGRGAEARPACDVLDRLSAEADSLPGALDEAARAHTLRVTEVVRGLKTVQNLSAEIRDSAMAASDSSARVDDGARRAARLAEKLESGSGEAIEITGRALELDTEGILDHDAGNVRALRPRRLPPPG